MWSAICRRAPTRAPSRPPRVPPASSWRPLAAFQLRGRAKPALVLGFGSVRPPQIRAAMTALAAALRRYRA